MLKTHQSRYLSIAVLIFALLAITIYKFAIPKEETGSAKSAKVADTPSSGPGAMRMITMSRKERIEFFADWANRQERVASISDAVAKAPFQFEKPNLEKLAQKDQALVAMLSVPRAVFLQRRSDDATNQEREVWIYYAGTPEEKTDEPIDPQYSLSIDIFLQAEKPDFQEDVAKNNKQREEGISKADKPHVLVDINGNEGAGIEPGYNDIGYGEDPKVSRRGTIVWWDSGVFYSMAGTAGPDGTSLDQMLQIARSME